MMPNTTAKEIRASRLANWGLLSGGIAVLCITIALFINPLGALFKVIVRAWPVCMSIDLVLSIWSLTVRRSRKGVWAAVLGFLLLLAFGALFVFVRLLQSR